MNSKYLRRIQRRVLLRVICGYRTISYDSVYAISGFPPIDITILLDIAFRENLSASSISNYDCILSPFFIPHPFERNAINIVQFNDKSTEDFPVICYTDGSKIDGRVGFAFVVFRSGVESENFQFRIRDECTVFVAELLCLNFAVKWITEQNSVISEYVICTDSLSSLDSLKNVFLHLTVLYNRVAYGQDQAVSAIFIGLARFGTSCIPNCNANIGGHTLTVTCIKRIRKNGEELTVTIGPLLTSFESTLECAVEEKMFNGRDPCSYCKMPFGVMHFFK
ncbi:uncharacterized protein TNCV_2588341 [Trichonephila clavipes]|nr:uncharacterized protein TNCV_2588341 [Trichonephila clavipes]